MDETSSAIEKLKTQIASAAPVQPRGVATSEFWFSTIASVLSVAFATGLIPTAGPVGMALGIGASILGALGYSVSRGMAKSGS